MHAADERDAVAQTRDLVARTRDDAADARAAGPHPRAASGAEHAAADGALAADDRQAAAEDREQAAYERLHALVDREILADELAIADNDPLTGARTRAAGMTDLDHELERCLRNAGELVVAYVDIVGLKALNDSEGHGAGDDLLRHAVEVIKAHLRPYDLVIRVGGDEFLCSMSNMTLDDARVRFAVIAEALGVAPSATAIRTGFAAAMPGDSTAELVSRADSQLIGADHAEHATRTEPARRRRERLPARPENVAPLRRSVLEFAGSGGAGARQLEDIAIAVSEALGNAVVHAYAGDDRPGSVSVDAWLSEGLLTVTVSDDGGGMLRRAASPGLGLGLPLIVRLTQQVAIEETAHGVRVRMTFAIG